MSKFIDRPLLSPDPFSPQRPVTAYAFTAAPSITCVRFLWPSSHGPNAPSFWRSLWLFPCVSPFLLLLIGCSMLAFMTG